MKGDSLTHTLVTPPNAGSLFGCLDGTADLTCDYVPDGDATERVFFTYKANDGNLDSQEVFTVFLEGE